MSPRTVLLDPVPRTETVLLVLLVAAAEAVSLVVSLAAYRSPWPVIAGFALLVTAALWAATARGEPLPEAPTGAAVLVSILVAVVLPWQLLRHNADALWFLSATAFLLLLLLLRGRPLAAWAGMIGSSIAVLVWSGASGFGIGPAALLVFHQVGILLLGSLFLLAVLRAESGLWEETTAESRLSVLDSAETAAVREREARLRWARSLAEPLLEAIAERDRLSPALRRQAGLVEAELRDGLRAPSLAAEPVSSAARRARERGVEVILLDDRTDPLVGDLAEQIRREVAADIDSCPSGRVVVRLLPEGRTPLGTVLVDGAEGRRRELRFPD